MSNFIKIVDSHTGTEATIAPHLGFNCLSFIVKTGHQPLEVLDSPTEAREGTFRPSGFGIPILFPFPNRIRGGIYQWEGKTYEIPLPEGKPDAIHGFCLDRSWDVIEQSESSVTGQFQLSVNDPDRATLWPADFILQVRYEVIGRELRATFRIKNPDSRPLPWGLGTHAYFKLPLSENSQPEDCLLQVPVTQEWELIETLPTGQIRETEAAALLHSGVHYGTRRFDNVFTGWQPDEGQLKGVLHDTKAGLEIVQTCSAELFREAVVFTPPQRAAACIEPYTCVTDAINLSAQGIDAGLRVLQPQESVETVISIEVRQRA